MSYFPPRITKTSSYWEEVVEKAVVYGQDVSTRPAEENPDIRTYYDI